MREFLRMWGKSILIWIFCPALGVLLGRMIFFAGFPWDWLGIAICVAILSISLADGYRAWRDRGWRSFDV